MIRVDNDYYIDVDEQCYTVKIDTHKTDKKGNEVYVIVGYYMNLQNAIKGVIDYQNKKKLKSENYDLKEALKIVLDNNTRFEKLLICDIIGIVWFFVGLLMLMYDGNRNAKEQLKEAFDYGVEEFRKVNVSLEIKK